MRKVLVAALVFLAVACVPYGSDNPDGPPAWKLAWHDEFDGTTLDATNWSSGWFGCAPVQSDERANYQPSQLVVRDGLLTINLERRDNVCNGVTRPYLSGNITSRGKRSIRPPVYIEARIWLDGTSSALYNWPAFWTNGSNWPTTGEQDVMEGLGQAANTWHGPTGQARVANFGFTSGWHVFGSLWEPGRVTAFLDGHRMGTYASSNVVTADHYVVGGLQVGKYGGQEKAPSRMVWDYVRTYKP